MRPLGPSDHPPVYSLALPRLRSGFLAAIGVAAMTITLLSASPALGAEAPLPQPNGLSAQSAAASCWEVKQVTPSAPSGVYWLVTPELGAPEQFYCDQQTDGGGWVLIGRGREDWSVSNEGWGTPADVRANVTGQAAFAPKQLSSRTIGALLDGGQVRSLDDGVRLRRATNQSGTSWQEVRFKFSTPRADWSWMFDNEQRVGSWRIGNASGNGGSTQSFGTGSSQNRVQTNAGSDQGWVYGFGYGTSARGNPSDSSYIWAPTTGSPNPRPFTQVYLRPELRSSSTFSVIPASGTPKHEGVAVHESFAQRTSWGVAGLGAGPSNMEGSNEVSAFAEANGVVYVGGNFTTVQQSSGGAGQVTQSYLAAFDVATGAWISSFRPTFNNQVKALAALPDGRIAAGGYFTRVNNETREGLVVLDPVTGATDPAFTGRLINRLSGGVAIVRGLDAQDGWLYASGVFTHSTSGSTERYTRSGVRFAVSNGMPDSWNPEFNGTPMSVDASSQGDRVYFAGYFTESAGRPAMKAAAVSTSNTNLIPWTVDFSAGLSGANYQQTVHEVGNRVWLGGAQHMFFSYDRATMQERSTNITKPGGDFQAAASNGFAVYGGCHCFHEVYVGADRWSNVGTNWQQASRINSIGAWNSSTGANLPDFSPILSSRNGAGAWALFVDSRGVLWAGGDYTASYREGFTRQWSGGFIRYAEADHQAPTTPSALGVSASGSGVRLAWAGSSDNRGAVTYQVLRHDRVVATTTGLSVDLPAAPSTTRYFVRAADAAGNWSASTPGAVLGDAPPTDPETATYISAGSDWDYWYNANAPSGDWKARGYNASSWESGNAPLGYGQQTLGTTFPTLDPKPITSYYRHEFNVADAGDLLNMELTTRADDGIVVYVNGTEVLRRNLDPGTLSHNYYASSSPNAQTAITNLATVVVPGSAFVTGTNVISAEVHSGYRSTPSHSFELTAVGSSEAPTVPEDPPDPPDDPGDPPDDPDTLIAAASNWSYRYNADAPPANWAATGYDSSGWSTGAAPLGYGHNGLGTTFPTLDPKPITSYYRHAFTVTNAATLPDVQLTTRADDGIIVYLNGVEVLRNNLDPGALSHNYYASSSPNATTAVTAPVTVVLPGTAFTTGTNVIAAEVHSGYRSTPSHSFELTAIAAVEAAGTPEEPADPADPGDPGDPPADPPDDPPADPEPGVLIAAASDWSYRYVADAPAPEWIAADFDASAWPVGPAPLGYGHDGLGTVYPTLDPKPITSYYRHAFTVTDAAALGTVTITTRADDGIIVYLNGVEILRNNLDPGPIPYAYYASSSPNAALAASTPITVQVPASAFLNGANIITAEVHSGYRSTPSHSFELTARVE